LAYDLEEIFKEKTVRPSQSIAPDPFLFSREYANYENFRSLSREVEKALLEKTPLASETIATYITLNPELWLVYYQLGQYFDVMKQKERASLFYRRALSKELPSEKIRAQIEKRL
jgi:tetratricopeptide (TPR) repeat protein